MTLTETSGKDPFLASDDYTLNILPKSYPTGQSSNMLVLIHNAFQPLNYWSGFMSKYTQYTGVAIDTHIYQMFDDQVCPSSTSPGACDRHSLMDTSPPQTVSLDEAGHIQSACGNAAALSNFNNNQLLTIVGEWTPAMTDCAKYLNGRGVGARYDKWLESLDSHDAVRCKSLGVRLEKVITFEKAGGWIQWTWKTESADDSSWSYSAGLQHGWIPVNPNERKYPNICG